jgi:heat shock protein HtpX
MLNNFKTGVLLAALIGLFMAVGYYFLGPQGVAIGLAFGGITNLVAYFYSDKIAIAAMGAREISRDDVPWLFTMVENLSARAGIPTPRIYVSPQAAPNAFATGRNPQHAAVAVTEGMLRNFPRDEIEGVLAHELAHVKHRDVLISTIAATLAGVISYVGYIFMFGGGSRDRENPFGAIGALLMIILAPLAAMLIQLAISRSREYAADAAGGELCGNPNKLASALARLGNANQRIPTDTPPAFHALYIAEPLSAGSLASSLFSTHPPIEKRIEALQQQAMQMR